MTSPKGNTVVFLYFVTNTPQIQRPYWLIKNVRDMHQQLIHDYNKQTRLSPLGRRTLRKYSISQ